METLSGFSGKLVDTSLVRLHGVSSGSISTAYSYAGMDDGNEDRFDDPGQQASEAGRPRHRQGDHLQHRRQPVPQSNPGGSRADLVTGPSVTEIMEGHTRWEADAINWVVHNFSEQLGLGGQDLRQLVIEPLAGDFNRIRANGAAWADVGTTMLATIPHLIIEVGREIPTDGKPIEIDGVSAKKNPGFVAGGCAIYVWLTPGDASQEFSVEVFDDPKCKLAMKTARRILENVRK